MTRVFPLFAIMLLIGCHNRNSEPRVSGAWVRLAAVPGQPAAAYFTLDAGGKDERLVRMESALVEKIELHESMKDAGGMTSMAPLNAIDIPAGGSIAFAPGARHAMLFGIDPAVIPGTAIPLRFGFANGKTAEAEAKTVAAGGDAPF